MGDILFGRHFVLPRFPFLFLNCCMKYLPAEVSTGRYITNLQTLTAILKKSFI